VIIWYVAPDGRYRSSRYRISKFEIVDEVVSEGRWLPAEQNGVQQAGCHEREGMFNRRAQPSPEGRRKEGFS
jgi:hypothetical protein